MQCLRSSGADRAHRHPPGLSALENLSLASRKLVQLQERKVGEGRSV